MVLAGLIAFTGAARADYVVGNFSLPGYDTSIWDINDSGQFVGAASSGVIGFGVEALYAQRGFTSSVLGASRKLSYIDVPAYLRVALPNETVTPFGYVGPQLSFELNCDSGNGACPSGRDKLSYAGIIGAGLKFSMLMNASIEGRYVYGLNDLNMGTVTTRANYQTRSFMLLAGIGF